MGVLLLRPALLDALSGVVGGFTTRNGGVSTGPLASLNLGLQPHERAEALVANWDRVTAALVPTWDASRVALNHQVHGRRVVRVRAPAGPLEPLERADALVTDRVGVVLAVKSADCVPVLLAAPGGVGAAHAGWRGVVAGVVPAAVAALVDLTDSDPAELVAVVGPHISAAAYEVGPEVVQALAGAGLDTEALTTWPGTRPHVDLGMAVEYQLWAAGVERVERVRRCTHGDPDLFSHRRDGPDTGRQAGVVARLP